MEDLRHTFPQVAPVWGAAVGAFVDPCAPVDAQVDSMSDAGFLSVLSAIGDTQAELDAYRVRLAGDVVERSRDSLGNDGLARVAGFKSPEEFVASMWKIPFHEAKRLCALGIATRARRGFDGTLLPSRFPGVGAAIETCTLSMGAAAAIVKELSAAAKYCSAEDLATAEQALVDHAPGFTVKEVAALALQVRNRLDQDGPVPQDEIRRARRSLKIYTGSDGMTHIEWVVPPEVGGLVKACIDAAVSEELRAARETAEPAIPDSVLAEELFLDDVTMEQRRSDAAEHLFRHLATCDSPAGDLPSVTMVVRMNYDDLITGLGSAEIDGVDSTISASTARQLAADAELIPIVFGGKSEILDFGTPRRLFTRAQKLALAERDGGCAKGGCSSPPAYAHAHHLQWWSKGGPTDLANGIMLCSYHHHDIHDRGWEIEIRDGVPYFIPPPWVDPKRTPQRGGKVKAT